MQRFFRRLAPALAFALPLAAMAQNNTRVTLLPPCTATGNCGLSDILVLLTNGAELLLGVSGAVALGFFVWAGFKYILSFGEPKKVQDAKAMMVGSVVGIGIILLAGVIVRVASDALTVGKSPIRQVGEACQNPQGASGIYVSVPAGFTNPTDPNSAVQEGLVCIAKDDCLALNGELQRRNRPERYTCSRIDSPDVVNCVRGLCPSQGADFACCRPKSQ